MIYDMRTYDIAMGKTPEYMAAVREVALPVRESYGAKLAGWYYADIGALNRVVHIWAYRDYAHFEEAREAFRSDERWLNEYVPRVQGIIIRQQNEIMRAADFFESVLMDCCAGDSESAGCCTGDSESAECCTGESDSAECCTGDADPDEAVSGVDDADEAERERVGEAS